MNPLRIGLLGLGTVGGGTFEVLDRNHGEIVRRAGRELRIVRVADLLATPWWRYLGLRTADDLRAALRTAHAAGLIARYSVVDDLEQITTRYALTDYLGQALRLPGG